MELQKTNEIQFLDEATFLRQCCTGLRNKIDFFLGSGASKTSGIPVGQEVVWLLKRDLLTPIKLLKKLLAKKVDQFTKLKTEADIALEL